MSKYYKNETGFTLIESLVYLALFAIFFGGTVAAAYNIMEASGREQTKLMVQEEGDFIVAKINWMLSGAQSIGEPASGVSGSSFSVAKVVGFDSDNHPILLQVTMAISDSNIFLSFPGNAVSNALVLNNTNTQIRDGSFKHVIDSGDGINPERIEAEFTLAAKTSGGADFSQKFTTITYLHK